MGGGETTTSCDGCGRASARSSIVGPQSFVEILADGGEPPSSVLGEIVREQPGSAADPNVRLNLIFVLATGARDVGSLLHWIVKMLGDNPAWVEKGQNGSAPADLPSRIVFETLRLEQSEVIMRKVTEAFSIDGFVVPADWYLRICVKESHSDPAIFANPGSFDPDRFIGMSVRPGRVRPVRDAPAHLPRREQRPSRARPLLGR